MTSNTCKKSGAEAPLFSCVWLSVVQQQLRNDAGRNRRQHVVVADLHPLVAARGRAQVVAAPVVHHVLVAAVGGRQAAAAMPLGAARAVVVMVLAVVAAVVAAAVVVTVVMALVVSLL